MAGSGTQQDPYIVTSWAECLSHMITESCYIKFANGGSKVIDTIELDYGYNTKEKEVDWNGWTVNNLIITCPYEDAITPQYPSSNAKRMNTVLYRSESLGIGVAAVWRNLNIRNFQSSSLDVCAFWGYVLLNCYIDAYFYGGTDTSIRYWSWSDSGGHSDKGENPAPFGYTVGIKSRISFHSSNVGPRVPFFKGLIDSELYIDYKWDIDKATTSCGIIPRAWFMERMTFDNVIINGTVDLRNDYDKRIIMPIMRNSAPEDNDYIQHHSGWKGGLIGDNITVNLKILTDDNSNTMLFPYTFGDTDMYTHEDDHVVPNNGTVYEDLKNSAYYANIEPILYGDLKNPNYLESINYRFKMNDNSRFPQYGNDYYTDGETYASDPDWTRQLSPTINGGLPFLPFYLYSEASPVTNQGAVDELPYITIFDLETPQNGFTGHGLGILKPYSCRIVEELNGAYNLTMTHPKDEEGMWQFILEMNIIKALGQLFVIQKVDEVESGGSQYVSCYAEHISYTLNDRWIFPPVTIAGFDGQVLIDSIISQSTDMGGDWQTNYTFNIVTDLNAPDDFRDWYEMSDGVTPYEMLIGSNGFISRIGGELYRDNFNMSIYERMQGAQDNAFEMAVGYNLTGIKRTVDLSTFCTYFRGYDVSDPEYAYEQWFAVSWDPSTLPRAYPRNVVRSKNFSYEHPEYAMGQLTRDSMAFFNQNCAPLISYTLNVKDLRRNPDYKGFDNNYRYKVGDKGRVWDERLKAWVELEITQTEKDGITGDCTQVTIGTTRSFTRPTGYVPFVPRPTVIIDADKIVEGTPPIDFISNGNDIEIWEIQGKSGGVGNLLTGDNLFNGTLEAQFYVPNTGQPASGMTSNVVASSLIEVESETIYSMKPHFINGASTVSYGTWIIQYDSNGNYVTYTTANTGDCTATTQSNTKYIRIQAGLGSEPVSLSTVDDFMLNKGSTVKPYEPYAEGYEISVTITSGGESNTVRINIPDKLYENDSISNEDETYSSITFPTYRGDCQLTVGTEVQPTVKFTYREV